MCAGQRRIAPILLGSKSNWRILSFIWQLSFISLFFYKMTEHLGPILINLLIRTSLSYEVLRVEYQCLFCFLKLVLLILMLALFMNFKLLFCQIRTLGMLRSRFQSLPGAFNACLTPVEKSAKPKGLKATFSRKFDEVHISILFYFRM